VAGTLRVPATLHPMNAYSRGPKVWNSMALPPRRNREEEPVVPRRTWVTWDFALSADKPAKPGHDDSDLRPYQVDDETPKTPWPRKAGWSRLSSCDQPKRLTTAFSAPFVCKNCDVITSNSLYSSAERATVVVVCWIARNLGR
jgi:hypothetical protein